MAVNKKKESFEVSFASDADYLINGLTADVSTIECIYDLIDNSIDAARTRILNTATAAEMDSFGLPASYKGYKIEVDISSSKVTVSDNCTGIDEKTLAEKVFTVGKKSKHRFGIGHYGIGLNRAIFKLGGSAKLETDNGVNAFTLSFSESDVRSAIEEKGKITASRTKTSKTSYYRIEITDIKPDVIANLGSETWIDAVRDQVRIRYSIFSKKGLQILIKGQPIGDFGPKIRNPDFLPRKTKQLTSQSGVSVYLEAGLHESYRIAKVDSDYSEFKSTINNLTPEYGWYVVCNDRVILVGNKGAITGWTTTAWHNEYHGFLGWVYYVSEDPSLLPWDTKKTGINSNNQTHIETLSWLKELADDYRTKNRQLRKKKSSPGQFSAPASGTSGTTTGAGTAGTAAGTAAGTGGGTGTGVSGGGNFGGTPSNSQAIHTKQMDMLIYDISTISRSPRIASFLQEAKEISIKENPYTAMILLRVLFESALRDYLIRHKHYQKVKDLVFQEQEAAGRSFTLSQKRDFTPTTFNMLQWVLKNLEIFDDDVRRATKTSLDSFSKDLTRLNGIVHEDGVLTDFSEAKQIRNNSYRALQTLLEH